MFFPKTLSREVSQFISQNPYDENRFLSKIKNDPDILIKFLAQSALSRLWFKTHFSLVLKLITILSKMIVNQTVSWEVVFKVLKIMIDNNRTFHAEIMWQGMKKDSDQRPYVCLVYAAHCPPKRQEWCENFKMNSQRVTIRGTNPEQYALIYQSFFSDDIFYRIKTPFLDLLEALVTCKNFEYQKGMVQLERMIIHRIKDFPGALAALSIATLHSFDHIREYALKFIENFPFYYDESGQNIVYNAILPSEDCFHPFAYLDSLNDYALNYQGIKEKKAVPLTALQLTVDDEAIVPDFKRLPNFFHTPRKKGPICFDSKPRHLNLNFDCDIPFSEDEVLGLMIAYKLVGIVQENYPKISLVFLEKLARIKPDLDYLHFVWCDEIDDEIIKEIPRLFVHLGRFGITEKRITPECFQAILRLKKLDTLELQECTLSIPEDVPTLHELDTLYLLDVKIESGSLNTFFKAAINVTNLSVITLEAFDLASYPYPEKIYELNVSSAHLKVINGVIEGLDRYVSLRKLYIKGKISAELNGAILSLIKMNKSNLKICGSN